MYAIAILFVLFLGIMFAFYYVDGNHNASNSWCKAGFHQTNQEGDTCTICGQKIKLIGFHTGDEDDDFDDEAYPDHHMVR